MKTDAYQALETREVTAKGVHIFTVCDASSEEAKRISGILEAIRMERMRHLFEEKKSSIYYELELRDLNLELAGVQHGSFRKNTLTRRQDEILRRLAEIKGVSKKKLQSLWEEYRTFVERLESKFEKRQIVVENITTTVGRSVLAQRLGGDTTYTGTVNYTALGSDNTAPVVGDATLGTEVYRKALSSGTDSSNIAYLETFYTASETTGTYEEYGMFIDGTGSADTGQLFNRFVSSITKSGTETLNVQSIITFNDA